MTEKRKEALLDQALGYISQIESGFGLYDCLHNGVGMTNAEIEEAGYELEEYYQSDTPEHLAAASGQRYITLEELERQARKAVEFIIQDGTTNTTSGNWILSFDELEKQSGLCAEDKPFFQQLIGHSSPPIWKYLPGKSGTISLKISSRKWNINSLPGHITMSSIPQTILGVHCSPLQDNSG